MTDPTTTPSPHDFAFGPPVSELYRDPAGYDPGDDLKAAVRVALWLGMPLLLTGDPGSGKTSLAHWLAWTLKLGEPLVFNVKSLSAGRDLLYEFDDLARFRDAQVDGGLRSNLHYLRLNALGHAILFSEPAEKFLAGSLHYGNLAPPLATPADPDHRFGRRHVVLIDELDKAPRDTPNDLLLELEYMRFRIRELDAWVEGAPDRRPIVIITSNSEKSLPEPFLRRCVFFNVRAPDAVRRREIVEQRNHPFARRAPLFEQAMRLFDELQPQLGRAPGTAELLAWLTVLERGVMVAEARDPEASPLQSLRELVGPSLGAIAKTKDDLELAQVVAANAEQGWP